MKRSRISQITNEGKLGQKGGRTLRGFEGVAGDAAVLSRRQSRLLRRGATQHETIDWLTQG